MDLFDGPESLKKAPLQPPMGIYRSGERGHLPMEKWPTNEDKGTGSVDAGKKDAKMSGSERKKRLAGDQRQGGFLTDRQVNKGFPLYI